MLFGPANRHHRNSQRNNIAIESLETRRMLTFDPFTVVTPPDGEPGETVLEVRSNINDWTANFQDNAIQVDVAQSPDNGIEAKEWPSLDSIDVIKLIGTNEMDTITVKGTTTWIGRFEIYGKDSRDKLDAELSPIPVSIYAGSGNDTLIGSGSSDALRGQAGNDHIIGGAGHDLIKGGGGFDSVHGGNGNDSIYGGSGNDILHGNNGNDLIDGELHDDFIDGGSGNDVLRGNEGNDYIRGGKWR